MALIGNVIADAFAGNPSSINYAIFTSVFCMLVALFGFAGAFVESLAIPIVAIVADGLAMLFSVIAGIVLAAKLHVHSCNNKVRGILSATACYTTDICRKSYLLSNSLTNGSYNMTKRCREEQASTAFFWFLFASFLGSFVVDFLGAKGGMSTSRRGGIRKGGPSMSQV